ncbi:MAG: hypothetical protein U1E66_04740 [Rhodospirillales bacterium]
MATLTFDTLKLARKLEAGGFTHEQATTAAEAFSDSFREQADVATKSDVIDLRAEFHRELAAVVWKIAALLLAQAGAIVAILKLLP